MPRSPQYPAHGPRTQLSPLVTRRRMPDLGPKDQSGLLWDGSLTLLGRGSVCINTAGEKVYPEEIEEALKTHPVIEDALVVGVPDEKWGQAVTGVVRLDPAQPYDEAAIRAHVRGTLAGYKTPKSIVPTERPLRASNGKADYKIAAEIAHSAVGSATPADYPSRRGLRRID